MKAYTDLEQSKKLAKILPPESADMYWDSKDCSLVKTPRIHVEPDCGANAWVLANGGVIAWSLAALLEQLDDTITCDDGSEYFLSIYKEDSRYYLSYHDRWGSRYAQDIETDYYDDLIDACYEMILKLNEQKLL